MWLKEQSVKRIFLGIPKELLLEFTIYMVVTYTMIFLMSKEDFNPCIYMEINISCIGHTTSIYWSPESTEKMILA